MKFHSKMIVSASIAIFSLPFCRNAFAQNFNSFNQLSFSGSAEDLVLKTGENYVPPSDSSLPTPPRTPFTTGTNSGNAVLGNSGQTTLTVTFDQFGRPIDSVPGSRITSDLGRGSLVTTLGVTPSSEINLQSTDVILNQDNNTGLDNVQTLGLIPTLSATGDVTRGAPNNSDSLNVSPTLPDVSTEIPIELTLPSISSISVFK